MIQHEQGTICGLRRQVSGEHLPDVRLHTKAPMLGWARQDPCSIVKLD